MNKDIWRNWHLLVAIILGANLLVAAVLSLSGGQLLDRDPAWSPDGSKIAFTSIRNGKADIYIMNADGSNLTRLTDNPDNDSSLLWSPDEDMIAFESERNRGTQIYLMNADGSNLTRLTDNVYGPTPAWSPDGSKIAFRCLVHEGSYEYSREIQVIDADGSDPTRLTNSDADDYCPVWSPDGSKIAFSAANVFSYRIYVIDADGSNRTRLTGVPEWFFPLVYGLIAVVVLTSAIWWPVRRSRRAICH